MEVTSKVMSLGRPPAFVAVDVVLVELEDLRPALVGPGLAPATIRAVEHHERIGQRVLGHLGFVVVPA